ncbi:MAG: nicotinate phosphoribosyltransferase, partial [Bacteroidota bacterium]|nr:nicotinate phosphoribosyltransferase [Bacteroidota bacterium]
GTKLVTAYDNPSLGAVYKLTALKNEENKWEKKIKLSEQKIKINNPGINNVMRFRKENKFFGDMIYEKNSKIQKFKMIDPNDSTRKKVFNKNYIIENLLIPIFKKGKLIYKTPSIEHIKKKLSGDLDLLDNSHKRLNNPHTYPVGIEENLFLEKQKMILKLRK